MKSTPSQKLVLTNNASWCSSFGALTQHAVIEAKLVQKNGNPGEKRKTVLTNRTAVRTFQTLVVCNSISPKFNCP
jgi:hypothetical protein